jgi:cytochrome c oxidase subunit 2
MAAAAIFALIVVASTVGLVLPFLQQTWWLPPLASQEGRFIDRQFLLSMAMCLVIVVPAQFGLALVALRYKDKGKDRPATYSHGNNKLEAMWVSLATVFFVGMSLMGQGMWAQIRLRSAPADALNVEVTGQQFAWNMRYPGPDGKFGRTRTDLISDSSGNPLGIDPDDPAGKDDLVIPTLVVPVDRHLNLSLKAKDVTHNFFVPEMRLKQDTVPGLVVNLHFKPTRIGKYEIACSELCGLGHYKMRSYMEVLSQADYDRWWKQQTGGQ